MTMTDRIKLAEAMDWIPYPMGADPKHPASGWESADNKFHAKFDPFTDANDERAVFRYMMERPFSVRRKYWRALRQIINERTDKLTKGGIEAAWPDALMFLEDGDYARAALKVLT